MPGSVEPTGLLQQSGPAQGAPQDMGSPPVLPGLPSAPSWQGGHPLGLLVTVAPAGGAQGGGQRPGTSVSGGACDGQDGCSHLDFIVLFLLLIGILEGIAAAPSGTTVAFLQAGELGLLLLSLVPAGLGGPALPCHL